MAIIDIINAGRASQIAHIDLLDAEFKRLTGRKVCRTCASDFMYMILLLKNSSKMSKQFKLKYTGRQYRLSEKSTKRVHSANLTDELAIEFLKVRPERIELFSEYPDNWEALVSGDAKIETAEETERRLLIEAELAAARQGRVDELMAELSLLNLTELREKYPDIKARSTEEFLTEVAATVE